MSRFGGFRLGKRHYFNSWDDVKAAAVSAPTAVTEFDYSKAQGIWNLRSTKQFSKKGPAYATGFTASLLQTTGDLDAWVQKTVDISGYAGATVRVVFKYEMIAAVFTADLQLDAIAIDGTTYSFENTGHSFETSTANTASYGSVSWSSLAVATTTGSFNVDTAGTGSANTGRTDAAVGSYYVYAETSSPANSVGFTFWLRSPEIVLGSSPTLTFYEARNGTSLGNLDVYLDVIA